MQNWKQGWPRFPNLSKLSKGEGKKKKDHFCSQEGVTALGGWGTSAASPSCKLRKTVRKQIPFSATHQNYNKVLTTKFRIHLSQNVLSLSVTPELSVPKISARFTKHNQHQCREVQLKATHLTSASLCIYWTPVWNKELGKISISTAHYWAKQAQKKWLRALEPKHRSCLPLNSFDITVWSQRELL